MGFNSAFKGLNKHLETLPLIPIALNCSVVVRTRRNTDYLEHLICDIDIRFSDHVEERTRRNSCAVLVHLMAYLSRDAESRAPVGSIPDSC